MGWGMSKPQQKIKVCCFCESWESGGIESFLYNVLTRIDMSGIQVDLVAARLGKSIFTEPLQKHGVRFFELSGSQRNILNNYNLFSSLLEEHRWDVIHLNIFHGLSLSYLRLAKQKGVSVRIAHSHNTALRKSWTRPIKLAIHTWAKEHFTQYATELWACSEDAAKFLFSKGVRKERRFQFIPNGIDTERFRYDPTVRNAVRAELGVEGMLVIGNVGRLCYQKNQIFLLDVFAQVLRQKPESRLLLLGEGEDKPLLQKRTKQLGIAEQVIFYGVTDRIEHFLWAMDVFAFPSLFEGFGIAAVEAQAAGLPVVCSEHIPPEARVTDLAQSVPLDAGAKKWSETLLAAALEGRRDVIPQIKSAGFDLAEVTDTIACRYKGVAKDGTNIPGV